MTDAWQPIASAGDRMDRVFVAGWQKPHGGGWVMRLTLACIFAFCAMVNTCTSTSRLSSIEQKLDAFSSTDRSK